jgi:hypothetical protein
MKKNRQHFYFFRNQTLAHYASLKVPIFGQKSYDLNHIESAFTKILLVVGSGKTDSIFE